MKKYKLKKFGLGWWVVKVIPILLVFYLAFTAFYTGRGDVNGQKTGKSPVTIVKSLVPREESLYEKYGRRYGISPRLLKAIARVESGEQASILGDDGESVGLFQIQPRWNAQRLKAGESLYNPEVSTRVACEILQELMDRYDTLDQVLTAYNRGHDDGTRDYANRVYEEMMKL